MHVPCSSLFHLFATPYPHPQTQRRGASPSQGRTALADHHEDERPRHLLLCGKCLDERYSSQYLSPCFAALIVVSITAAQDARSIFPLLQNAAPLFVLIGRESHLVRYQSFPTPWPIASVCILKFGTIWKFINALPISIADLETVHCLGEVVFNFPPHTNPRRITPTHSLLIGYSERNFLGLGIGGRRAHGCQF